MEFLKRLDRHQQKVHENQQEHGVLYKGISPGARRVMSVSLLGSVVVVVGVVLALFLR